MRFASYAGRDNVARQSAVIVPASRRIGIKGDPDTPHARSSAATIVAPDSDDYVTPAIHTQLVNWSGTVIVEAPAGYGKTALLASLGRRADMAGRAVGHVAARADASPAGIERAIAALDRRANTRAILIVDDAHLLDRTTCARLDRLIDCKGETIQFVIASRAPLPLGVSRRVVAREALLATADDLALGDTAIARMLVDASLPDPSLRAAIARLAAGWPAGVRIAMADAQRGATDRAALLDRLTRRDGALDCYLSQEVLVTLEPDAADLLGVLATLGKFSSVLVQKVAGICDAEHAIADLERRGLFLRTSGSDWRTINPMVGACLEARLRRTDPKWSRALHLAAADWHEKERQLSEAIAHAFAGGDAERAVDLLAQSSGTHERIGRWRAFTDWTTRLNDAALDRHPAIRIEAAAAHAVLFEFDVARAHLGKLTDLPPALSTVEQAGLVAAQAIFGAFSDDPVRALDAGERGRAARAPADAYTRGVFDTASAIGRIARGEITVAHRLSVDARATHERGGSAFGATFALALSGLTLAIGGKLREAVAHWHEGTRLIRTFENPRALEAVASGYLPIALYEWNDLEEAEALIDSCLASSVEVALPDAIASIYVAASRIAAARDDRSGVERWSNEGLSLAVRRQWPRLYKVAAWEPITFALQQGRVGDARRLRKRLDRDQPLAGASSDGLDVEGNCAALRYDLHVCGDRAAMSAVRTAIVRARNEGRLWRAARLLTIEAHARECMSDRPGALRALRRALEIGETGHLIRTFVDEGPEILALVQRVATEEARAPKQAIDPAYLDDILEAGGEHRTLADGDARAVEPLSKREAEVLTMVAAGLANKAIGERLFMSVNTVKWHLQHVFAKLGAGNRTRAVIVARSLSFID